MEPLPASVLPAGVRSRIVPAINGLDVHLLEAGPDRPDAPCILLLHGFPELAYSWCRVMPALATAGYRVLAPDQRGYGRTTGWDARYDGDLASFRFLNLLRDAVGVVDACGRRLVDVVVGHDFGATVAAYAALVRPDLFKRLVLMSEPFAGPPTIRDGKQATGEDVHAALAALPRPRKHYQWYYSTRKADDDMWRAPQGLHAFLRAYFHYKSADWTGNRPFPLAGWTPSELAKMPTYYAMDLDQGMAATVAREMPTPAEIAANRWLTEAELAVFAEEFGRTGFQGALQWYCVRTGSGHLTGELEVFAGRTIDVPSLFIGGGSDWGVHQAPGALDRMVRSACTDMKAVHLVDGAGHWAQQEQPEAATRLLLDFLRTN